MTINIDIDNCGVEVLDHDEGLIRYYDKDAKDFFIDVNTKKQEAYFGPKKYSIISFKHDFWRNGWAQQSISLELVYKKQNKKNVG